MIARKEKKQETKAMLISLGVHGVVFLLLLFLVAWRAPNPPHPEYGIELNFGLDAEGTGDIQPTTPVGSDDSDEQEEIEENPEESSSPAESESVEDPASSETSPVEPEVVSKVESPVIVEEKKQDPSPEEQTAEKPVEKPAENEESKPTDKPKAVFQPDTKTDGAATNKQGDPASQGDSKNKTGDKGNPEGELDADALYGNKGGGGGGPALDLAGWDWDNIPEPKTPENEPPGRIVFTIEVDANGELIRYRKESGTLSAAAERACVEAIQKLTFTKKSGAKVPQISKGKITFVVRSE